MFEFLRNLFGGASGRLRIDGYWCETSIKFSNKITTPLGSKVSVVNTCVDISHSVQDDQITIHDAWLSGGTSLMGSSQKVQCDRYARGKGFLCFQPVADATRHRPSRAQS